MVVQIVTEKLDVRDRRRRHGCICKMTREEYESNVADLVAVSKAWHISNLKRRIST